MKYLLRNIIIILIVVAGVNIFTEKMSEKKKGEANPGTSEDAPTSSFITDATSFEAADEEDEKLDADAYSSRDWTSLMAMPTDEQIDSVKGLGRSPYIALYMHFPGVRRAMEYCADFHADHQPKGTYLCPFNWWMDVSSLKEQYTSVYNDYTGTPGGYCGFQRLGDGSRVFIMTVWTTFCEDSDGNVTVFTPKVVYPENKGEANRTNAEGSFVQCILPYDWRAGRDYRVLIQQTNAADTGNVVLTSWVYDMTNHRWDELVSFDTGIRDIYMYSCGGFLENFLTEYTGEVRTMELSNMQARSADTGEWVAADYIQFTVNGSLTNLGYIGSCNFDTDGASLWAITSGVSGLCETPSDEEPYYLEEGVTGDPY